jgi:hypothetical protein
MVELIRTHEFGMLPFYSIFFSIAQRSIDTKDISLFKTLGEIVETNGHTIKGRINPPTGKV